MVLMNRDSKILGSDHAVIIDGKYLDQDNSLKVRNHSPDGFSWGYGGSGPSQLALALLLEATSKEEAVKCYQDFKWDVVAGLPESFSLNASVIYDWLEKKKSEKPN
jgi:hypothetical protein